MGATAPPSWPPRTLCGRRMCWAGCGGAPACAAAVQRVQRGGGGAAGWWTLPRAVLAAAQPVWPAQMPGRVRRRVGLCGGTRPCAAARKGRGGCRRVCRDRRFAHHDVRTRAGAPTRTGERRRGGNRRPVPAPSWCGVWGRRGCAGRSSARLHLDVQLAHLVAVGTRVVPAEEKLATGGQDSTDLGRRPATVTAVGGGQLGPGKGSRLHSGLPPSRHRVAPVSLDATNRLRGTSTLADARHPGSDSRRASRHPSRRDRVEVRPPSRGSPGGGPAS